MKTPPAALRPEPDEAILRLARALARQAAKEDHDAEQTRRGKQSEVRSGRKVWSEVPDSTRKVPDRGPLENETRRDLRPLLD